MVSNYFDSIRNNITNIFNKIERKEEKLSIKTGQHSQTISKVSDCASQCLGGNIDNAHVLLLVKSRIKQLQSSTEGIRGWFAKKFSPNNYQKNLSELESLQKLILSIKTANSEVGREEKSPDQPNLQSSERASEEETNIHPLQEQAVDRKEENQDQPNPQNSKGNPEKEIQSSKIKAQLNSSALPSNLLSALKNKETTDSLAPSSSTETRSPPDFLQQIEGGDKSPTPGKLNFKIKFQPPASPPQKKVANEPDSPSYEIRPPQDSTAEKLSSEITTIKEYLEGLKRAVDPLKLAFEKHETLDVEMKELRKDVASLDSKIKMNEDKMAILKQPADVVHLKLKISESETLQFPLFSDEKFKAYNQKLEEKGLPRLENKYLKSTELRVVEEELGEQRSEKKELGDRMQLLGKELEEIKESKNGEISFSEYKGILEQKKELTERWERALRFREKQLDNLSTGEVKPVKPKEVTEKAARKASLEEVIQQDSTIAEEFPELRFIANIKNSQNANILLKGENYHDKLST